MANEHPPVARQPTVTVVLGVSGSGKSTVGALLAQRLGTPFADADDFHTSEDRATMAGGRPLTDEERRPWLGRIARWMDTELATGTPAVLACSALKRAHRDFLRAGRPGVRLLYLQGSREAIAARLAGRVDHFFPAHLLESQFEQLEEPAPDEHACVVPLGGSVQETVERALELLDGADPRPHPEGR